MIFRVYQEVLKHYKVSEEELLYGGKEYERVLFARQVICYILRYKLKMKFEFISALLNYAAHTTVIYSIKQVEKSTHLKNTVEMIWEMLLDRASLDEVRYIGKRNEIMLRPNK